MSKYRVWASIGTGTGAAIGVTIVFLATAIHKGDSVRDVLAYTAVVAAIGFLVASGATFLAAKLRDMP